MHDSSSKETPLEKEILRSLFDWAAILLAGLERKVNVYEQGRWEVMKPTTVHAQRRPYEMTNLDHFLLNNGVQPFNERLNCGIFL